MCKKNYQKGPDHALPLQLFVATIMELKVRAGTIFRDCEKSLTLSEYSSSPSLWSIRLEGGKEAGRSSRPADS